MLDPFNLTPEISLNRVRVVDLPGMAVDSEVKGRTGYELVSTAALAAVIRQHNESLYLDSALDDPALCLAFDDCLSARAARFRTGVLSTSELVARRIGRNLGYLLLTLRRGDAVNREARPEWDDSYWQHWASVAHVWLAGGVVSGRLGAKMLPHTLAVFREAGIVDFSIELSPYGVSLPLVGLARAVPAAGIRSALVLDFGGTMIKRGYAVYDRFGEVVRLRRMPALPTGWDAISRDFPQPDAAASALRERVLSVMAASWSDMWLLGTAPSGVIRTAFAVYMRGGQPLMAQRGVYMTLCHLTDNLQRDLTTRLHATLGERINLALFHDGTAAALAHAGSIFTTAVVTVGTALGVGFPPSAGGLRPLSREFVLVEKD